MIVIVLSNLLTVTISTLMLCIKFLFSLILYDPHTFRLKIVTALILPIEQYTTYRLNFLYQVQIKYKKILINTKITYKININKKI
jgi:hypothetical protein